MSKTNPKKQQRPKEIFLSRNKCDCVAQKHDLINNCLSCGKVVCAMEGEGPCLYCGNLVTRNQTNYIQNNQTLFPTLSKEQLASASIERSKAIQHKNLLVERDQSSLQNQNIFDDQIDYYQVTENQWLDQEDRQKAVDRILEKSQFVENQNQKVSAHYDSITGQFVRDQFKFDQDSFKKQGASFMHEQERKQVKEKMEKAKKHWDNRMLSNDKMKQLCKDLIHKKQNQDSLILQKLKPKAAHITELVLQNDEDGEKNQNSKQVEQVNLSF